MKTQKVVNFPFKDFDPTAYLASVPQQTILRHKQLQEQKKEELTHSTESQPERIEENEEYCWNVKSSSQETIINGIPNGPTEQCELLKENYRTVSECDRNAKAKVGDGTWKGRTRLESTSLLKTPIIDEHLKDYHQHKLLRGQDKLDLKYQLYAVVVSML